MDRGLEITRDSDSHPGPAALRQRDAILQAVCSAAEKLLKGCSLDDCIRDVLAELGEATQVSRVYVFANEPGAEGEDTLTTLRYEWVAAGIHHYNCAHRASLWLRLGPRQALRSSAL